MNGDAPARPRGGERGQRRRERAARQRGWDLPAGRELCRVGDAPVSVALGDVNADGRPDLAVANVSSDNVSVLLGNGNGTFQPDVTFAAGDDPTSVALGDVNGDGQPDLAVANFASDNVSVLLGNGDGTFQPAVNFAAGNSPRSVALADVNRDGRPDLAVANRDSDNVSVLLNFVPPPPPPPPPPPIPPPPIPPEPERPPPPAPESGTAPLGLLNPQPFGCDFTRDEIACAETGVTLPFIRFDVDIPENAGFLQFDYTFTGADRAVSGTEGVEHAGAARRRGLAACQHRGSRCRVCCR